jgi:hypothetical protein
LPRGLVAPGRPENTGGAGVAIVVVAGGATAVGGMRRLSPMTIADSLSAGAVADVAITGATPAVRSVDT